MIGTAFQLCVGACGNINSWLFRLCSIGREAAWEGGEVWACARDFSRGTALRNFPNLPGRSFPQNNSKDWFGVVV